MNFAVGGSGVRDAVGIDPDAVGLWGTDWGRTRALAITNVSVVDVIDGWIVPD